MSRMNRRKRLRSRSAAVSQQFAKPLQTSVVPLPGGWTSCPRVDPSAKATTPFQEAATQSVQRRRRNPVLMEWQRLFWGMALLGLFLLPSDYRAGAETGHSHSLIQLWLDAGDGQVRHEHFRTRTPNSFLAQASSWFEPEVNDVSTDQASQIEHETSDVGDQHESAPTASEFHLNLLPATLTLLSGTHEMPIARSDRRLAGLSPPILLPPPRWTLSEM